MSELRRISVEEEIREAMKNSKKEFTQETLDRLAALLRRLDEKCPPQPHLPLTFVRVSSTSVFDSKLGGVPYFPKDMEYPRVLEGALAGKPLRLLAQLNFSTLPHLEGFPQKGILQFLLGVKVTMFMGLILKTTLSRMVFASSTMKMLWKMRRS